jgi:hypothetical protein
VNDIVAERDRSVVSRIDGTIHKHYRRADPRNDVERTAYEYLRGYPTAPVPTAFAIEAGSIVLEDVQPLGDFEHALRSGTPFDASRALGTAYAALHDVPAPSRAPTPFRLERGVLTRWCGELEVPEPDMAWAVAAYEDPGDMIAFSHGDPAPSNALVRADGSVVLIDFEYARARHRGYDVAAWHVLCPLERSLLGAFDDGYGREIERFAALVVLRAVQVVGMNGTELLDADREFAPGWSARSSLLTALRRGGAHEPGLLRVHDALARRWPEAVDRLPIWA